MSLDVVSGELQGVLDAIKKNGGFLSATDLKIVAQHDRLRLILVRCGNGRFLAPAQDVEHFVNIIERDYEMTKGSTALDADYIRDYSFPTSDPSQCRIALTLSDHRLLALRTPSR